MELPTELRQRNIQHRQRSRALFSRSISRSRLARVRNSEIMLLCVIGVHAHADTRAAHKHTMAAMSSDVAKHTASRCSQMCSKSPSMDDECSWLAHSARGDDHIVVVIPHPYARLSGTAHTHTHTIGTVTRPHVRDHTKIRTRTRTTQTERHYVRPTPPPH